MRVPFTELYLKRQVSITLIVIIILVLALGISLYLGACQSSTPPSVRHGVTTVPTGPGNNGSAGSTAPTDANKFVTSGIAPFKGSFLNNQLVLSFLPTINPFLKQAINGHVLTVTCKSAAGPPDVAYASWEKTYTSALLTLPGTYPYHSCDIALNTHDLGILPGT